MLKKDFILDVGITNETSENILEYILERLNTDQKFYMQIGTKASKIYLTMPRSAFQTVPDYFLQVF
jgi:hypothetical protein